MSSIDDPIIIDCSNRPSPRKPAPRPSASRSAPVALGQKPEPPRDRWDECGGSAVEWGGVEEWRAQLVGALEEALARARGEWPDHKASRTWPYTRMGLLLLRAINLADLITRKIDEKEKP